MSEQHKYDVVVVGGGPGGSSAARVAAKEGAKTILLEEHPQIGLPEHCMGVLGTPSGTFIDELIKKMDKRVVLAKIKSRRMIAPDATTVEFSFENMSVYILERNLFDLELAKQAAEAGVEVFVNTRVTGIMHKDGVVTGVTTNSKTMPEIHGKIVIAADGIRALVKGIPEWEGLAKASLKVVSGIKWHLSGCKLDPGILEIHLGSFCGRGFLTIAPLDSSTCLTDIPYMEDLETIKAGNWVVSKELRNCSVLRMTGWSHPMPMSGIHTKKKVKAGLVLVGDAARGLGGIDYAVASGVKAGEVAVRAVKGRDVSEKNLREYEEFCREIESVKGGYAWQFERLDLFHGLSEKDIQEEFDQKEGKRFADSLRKI
jgi:digeranylgeranylglycerophospholipid reductase